jgi:predicted AAA+ superfamily ATPase
MYLRLVTSTLHKHLSWSPAVALLGPRQVGKTTLARQLLKSHPGSVYLDLESATDRARLGEGPLFLRAHADRLVVLDEVQEVPGLFSVLRTEIDRDRRPGRFVLLGSASFELLRQSQSLAGRLSLIDMFPLLAAEVGHSLSALETLWLRGGFPASFDAASEQASWAWREAFIRHLVHTDLPALGLRTDAQSLQRFWRMLAHVHGQLFNASAIANSLDVSSPTVGRWLDQMVGALLVRRLEPLHTNLGKRLVKSPKVYVRDSGLLHSLLGLPSSVDLQGHPMAGASWEGFVIEQIAAHLPAGASLSFYRTAAGAELDAVIEWGQKTLGFEIKFSLAPKVGKGFWQAVKDLAPQRTCIVAPVPQGWPVAEGVDVITVADIAGLLAG